jgi:hypothetical protein
MARAHLLETASALVARIPAQLSSAPDDSLVLLLTLVGDLRRGADAIGAQLAAELDRRSAAAETSLARSLGERTSAVAVARLAGIDPTEAHDWVSAGTATAHRPAITGELLPPRYEQIALALTSAAITPRAAQTMIDTLDTVARQCGLDEVAQLERLLLDYAPQLTTRELARLCRQAVDRFDTDGVQPREDELRGRSGITVTQGRDGLVTWIVKMHPEAAGLITAAVDARTAPQRMPSFDENTLPLDDPRTLPQKRLDALVDLARESLAHDNGRLAGTAVTMSVTMTLDALVTGVGTATIAGVDEPISARTARRLAADADIIPILLGSRSEPLDVGRASRLFTEPQRRALAVRDGGCVWPGCDAPPGWCEVAHLTPWWRGGQTDLANGALLCRFHHRRLDNDGWTIETREGTRWLVPPPWVDARQTPRRAGRLPRVA